MSTTTEPVSGEDSTAASPDADISTASADPNPTLHERITAFVRAHAATFPSMWSERCPSLAEIWDYSARGEWSPRADGQRRSAHQLYSAAAIGVIAALLTAVWIVRSPARCGLALVFAVVFSTAGNSTPILHYLIPDVCDLTAWWAWLFG